MKLTNITVDQLIADLNVARGKAPFIGQYFLTKASVDDNKIRLSFVEKEDADKGYSIVISGAEWEGHEFDAEFKEENIGPNPMSWESVHEFARITLVKILKQLADQEPEKEPRKYTQADMAAHIDNIAKVLSLLE